MYTCASPLREKSSQQVPELCPFCWIILYLYFLWQSWLDFSRKGDAQLHFICHVWSKFHLDDLKMQRFTYRPRGHSFFSSPPQRRMTSDFEGFSIPNFIHYIYFPILILEKEPVFPFLMFSAKQGNYWYHFYNHFGMTRSLTGDWTRDFPHSMPAFYQKAIEEALSILKVLVYTCVNTI